MSKLYRMQFLDSESDKRKSKTCTERSRSIQNLKSAALLAIGLTFAMCGAVAQAQQPTKIPRIGYVAASSPEGGKTHREVFRRGLRELGYIEGKDILIEFRYLDGMSDRSPSVVAELMQLKVDVLVSTSPSVIGVAKRATNTIPVVMVTVVDPVAEGLIDSLARPGGNVTGITRLTRDLSGKRLELFKEAVPRISLVGVLLVADSSSTQVAFKEYEAAAAALKIQLQSLEVRGPKPDFERAFREAAKRHVNALITVVMAYSYVTRNGLRTLLSRTGCLQCSKQLTRQRPVASCPIQPTTPRASDAPQSTSTKS
jgi:ABC-type uncharacterized transport system substrate-binding protein